jgi:DNA-binding transcriptional regulator LsrR (DeoR family)
MRGLTQQEIASEIGLSQMTVGRVLKDIGKKYMRT